VSAIVFIPFLIFPAEIANELAAMIEHGFFHSTGLIGEERRDQIAKVALEIRQVAAVQA
jgi:hypothetical protein